MVNVCSRASNHFVGRPPNADAQDPMKGGWGSARRPDLHNTRPPLKELQVGLQCCLSKADSAPRTCFLGTLRIPNTHHIPGASRQFEYRTLLGSYNFPSARMRPSVK